ncbi:MAG: sirohydrochlorin chelatase [Angustibacter sp.]
MGHHDVLAEPVLVACAHGTREPAGRRAVGALIAAVRAARPSLVVRTSHVDVQPPAVADVVRRIDAAGRSAVVVPLLLSTGYHVRVDVAAAVHGRSAVAVGALGPDSRLTALLQDRLRRAGLGAQDAIVLAAAGSSDPRSSSDVEAMAEDVRRTHRGPVIIGYAATAQPSVPAAVDQARRTSRRVVVASYLLAPGFFHRRLQDAGADDVTDPLVLDGPPDQRLIDLVLDRYDTGRASLAGSI